MDLNTARARIHALLPILDNPADADTREAELDQRIDDLIAAAQNPATETPTVKFLPPRNATCASCGHTGADHHHADTKCWANLPRTRQPNGTWSAVPICDCLTFRSA